MAVYQTLSIKEISVDTLANTSQVQILWKSQQTGESHNDNARTAKYWITAGGTKTEYSVSYTLPAKTTKTILNKTITAPHNSDGTGTVKVQTWMDTRISAGEVELSKSLTLTPIAKASTIGATDAFVESTALIAVSRKSEDYTHSVAFTFGDLAGYLDAEGTISDVEVRHTATNIPFVIPPSFYAQMPAQKSKACQLICRTYQDDTQIGSDQTATFTVTAREELCRPIVDGEAVDINPNTVALTGNADVLIRHMSQVQCQMRAQAQKGAALVTMKIGGQQTDGSLLVGNAESGEFTFSAEDSRGFVTTQTVTKTLIPYIPVTLNAKVARTDPTTGNGILEVSGQCYGQSFGAQTNPLTVSYRVNGAAWQRAEPVVEESGLRYTVQETITGLDYTTSSTVEITVEDALSQKTQTVTVNPGVPVFDWGEKDFVFHAPVAMDGYGITHLGEPAAETDAATKGYTDGRISAVKEYADSKLSMAKLWTNPEPTASFGAQTVELDLSHHAGVSIYFKGVASGAGHYMSEVIPVGTGAFIHCHALNGDIRQRNVVVSSAGVRFEAGQKADGENNAFAVPVAIYGWAAQSGQITTPAAICGAFLCGEALAGQ